MSAVSSLFGHYTYDTLTFCYNLFIDLSPRAHMVVIISKKSGRGLGHTCIWPQQNDYTSDYFKVCFKIGNISICNGGQSFAQSEEIVIQHAEFRHYTNPRTGLPASKYGNVYYHPKRACIQLKWGSVFDSNKLVVPEAITEKLTAAQKQQLCQEFTLVL